MLDTTRLAELKALIAPEAVLADDDSLTQYSYDWWPVARKWKQQGKQPYRPDVVIRAVSSEQVSRVLRWASGHVVPVTPWGAGSSVTGAPLPMRGGLVLDMSSMKRVLALDEPNLMVRVQAGKLGSELERELNEKGYTLNHSPQSLDRSTVGGWVSTRATGQFSSKYGGIEDLTVAFTAILATGEIVETRLAPRAAIGPDFRHLFMGAEGTLGVITDVTLRIFPLAPYRHMEAFRLRDVRTGVEVMRMIMRKGLRPFLVRYYDEDEARHVLRDKDFSGCTLFLGFDGEQAVAEAEVALANELVRASGGISLGAEPVNAWMNRRFDFSTVENLLATTGGYAETIEIAHFWDSMLDVYGALKEALKPLAEEVLGHFSHVYQHGTSLYMILLGHAATDAEAEARILHIWNVAMRICQEHGAAISHHHGIGLARLPYIRDEMGTTAALFDRMKGALDPAGILNPGKFGTPR